MALSYGTDPFAIVKSLSSMCIMPQIQFSRTISISIPLDQCLWEGEMKYVGFHCVMCCGKDAKRKSSHEFIHIYSPLRYISCSPLFFHFMLCVCCDDSRLLCDCHCQMPYWCGSIWCKLGRKRACNGRGTFDGWVEDDFFAHQIIAWNQLKITLILRRCNQCWHRTFQSLFASRPVVVCLFSIPVRACVISCHRWHTHTEFILRSLPISNPMVAEPQNSPIAQ